MPWWGWVIIGVTTAVVIGSIIYILLTQENAFETILSESKKLRKEEYKKIDEERKEKIEELDKELNEKLLILRKKKEERIIEINATAEKKYLEQVNDPNALVNYFDNVLGRERGRRK